jgi:hypothetical protein
VRWPVAIARKLGRVIPEAIERFFADQCPQQAAGIAYRVLFSIAPLAIVLVSIFGLVLQDDSVRQDVVNTIVDALPVSAAGRHDVEDAITAIATLASAAGLLSLLVFAWAASGNDDGHPKRSGSSSSPAGSGGLRGQPFLRASPASPAIARRPILQLDHDHAQLGLADVLE